MKHVESQTVEASRGRSPRSMSEAWIETFNQRPEAKQYKRSPRSMSEAWIETPLATSKAPAQAIRSPRSMSEAWIETAT